ncbi:MAG: DUF1343 domain-containing protein [Chlorobiaceae bacterium]
MSCFFNFLLKAHPSPSRLLPALSLLTLSFLFQPLSLAALRCGIDRLEESEFAELSTKRVGIVTNAASRDLKGEPTYRALLQHGVRLKFIMAPEHGFSVDIEAGLKVPGRVIADSLPVYSLYGATRKPDAARLRTVDILLFDLQDVGTRCYTYISTMKAAMEACQDAGIPFMVLDRPNPVAPMAPEGFMVAPRYESFVSSVNIPFIHSMTVGEIAAMLKAEQFRALDLRVISMSGYSRTRFADEYPGFTFISPSPNIRSVAGAIAYPATVLLEATAVSEGRGSDAPFEQFGAPFIDSRRLSATLEGYKLPGVIFEPVRFTPVSGKFKGEMCYGLKLNVSDRGVFQPFPTAVAILLELERLYPQKLDLHRNGEFFDRLAGTGRLRTMIISRMPLKAILSECRPELEAFRRRVAPYLLYD